MSKTKITAEEFDSRFDSGEDIFDIATPVSISREGIEITRINLDLPNHIIRNLDRQAQIIGITRQSLIKTWPFERLKQEGAFCS
jgi:hypothetical protein